MKQKILAFFVITLFISGCGNSAFMMLDKSPAYQKALHYTQQKELRNYLHTLAIMRVTYLSPLNEKLYGENPTFFVGINIKNDFARKKKGIYNPLFDFTANNTKMIDIEEVIAEHPLYKEMPVINRWSRYYKITFIGDPQTAIMNLKYMHKQSNESVVFTFDALSTSN
jgi:hypothetical protein